MGIRTRRDFFAGAFSASVVGGSLAVASSALAAPPRRDEGFGLPMPTVSGPLKGGRRGWALGTFSRDLDKLGYLDDEFLVSGLARRYEYSGPYWSSGAWEPVSVGVQPFTTRIVVRRPKDPQRFNGALLQVWNNVTLGYDLAVDTRGFYDGYAIVFVTTQHSGVHGSGGSGSALVNWDPERYGALNIASDALSYDIFTQVARLVGRNRPKAGLDPLGGLDVRQHIATGISQSAARLVTYANTMQPRYGAFDAIVPALFFSEGSGFGDAGYGQPGNGFPCGVRPDLKTPVIIVNSESETEPCMPIRQPDSRTFRFWEVTGSAHIPQRLMMDFLPTAARDRLPFPPPPEGGVSQVPWDTVLDSALVHVRRWVSTGRAPPSQPRIVVGPDWRIQRDRHGIALGGVRLPEVDAPTAQNTGIMAAKLGFARLGGTTRPFSKTELLSLYPDHATYVRRVKAAAERAVRAGVLLSGDGQTYVAAAAAANIPG